MMKAHRTRMQFCPRCRAPLDAATAANPECVCAPAPGSVTVCLYCGAVLEWDEGMALVVMSQEGINSLPDETRQVLCKEAMNAGLVRGKMFRECQAGGMSVEDVLKGEENGFGRGV